MVAKNIKRLGVGATASANFTKDAVAEADWTKSGKKKILSVGKRQDDDDDAMEHHDSSSDEEEGRTSAVKERKRKVPSATNDAIDTTAAAGDVPKTKKNKKGKKERNAAADAAVADAAKEDKESTSEDGEAVKSEVNEDAERKKPKRKKSRSKQKNIRKDNRSESDRPSYLNVGSAGYAGRPLTKATKDKLGLGSKCEKEEDPISTEQANPQTDAGVVESTDKNIDTMVNESKEDTGELSKIGDCVVGEIVSPREGTNDKMKKKPKRKFKNF